MDINMLAATTISILAPYLAKAGEAVVQKAGEASWEKATELYQTLKTRLSKDKDDFYQQALERFEKEPEKWKSAMENVLKTIMTSDEAFAKSLSTLLEEANDAGTMAEFNVQVYGGKVKNIVNVKQADDITFN